MTVEVLRGVRLRTIYCCLDRENLNERWRRKVSKTLALVRLPDHFRPASRASARVLYQSWTNISIRAVRKVVHKNEYADIIFASIIHPKKTGEIKK
jgi:hypothetical protein